ncbi:hypothetical protein HG542_27430 [Streptomyces morookaense]|uniref:Uncharacterized protein n=1 Tax=Streptomyces morookaense TaxID=1970 RepID=A0A7Y7EAC8_STRMO|nr:hypothetical protein [Streptomyces morookaense]
MPTAPPPSPSPSPSAPASRPPAHPPVHLHPGYRHASAAVNRPPSSGISLVMFTLLITAPAILAAVLLRPRSASGPRH